MVIPLADPVGIGKSTPAEALTESIDECVVLDGDHVIVANPPLPGEVGYGRTILTLLIEHHNQLPTYLSRMSDNG